MALNQYQPVNREAIWAALFALLKSKLSAQFTSMGRRHVAPPDLTTANQPALFQVVSKETHVPQKAPGTPSRLELRGFLILYLFDSSPDEVIGSETVLAETALNALLMAIDGAFLPDDFGTGKLTLGGLVKHCWIEGDTDVDPGIFGPQCAAILPVKVLV